MDYDQNGTVGFSDFGTFVAAINSTSAAQQHVEPIEDVTGNDVVGFPDFGAFVASFNRTAGPSGTTSGTTACP